LCPGEQHGIGAGERHPEFRDRVPQVVRGFAAQVKALAVAAGQVARDPGAAVRIETVVGSRGFEHSDGLVEMLGPIGQSPRGTQRRREIDPVCNPGLLIAAGDPRSPERDRSINVGDVSGAPESFGEIGS
jgi:hypothetical protein